MRKLISFRLLILGALSIILATSVTWFFVLPHHHIHEDSQKNIRVGMSFQEVKTILGSAPGDYGPGIGIISPGNTGVVHKEEQWLANSVGIVVSFDKRDCVTSVHKTFVHRDSYFEIFLQRLGVKTKSPTITTVGSKP